MRLWVTDSDGEVQLKSLRFVPRKLVRWRQDACVPAVRAVIWVADKLIGSFGRRWRLASAFN